MADAPIQVEPATVFRGGGRRWFTLKAACRAEARARVRQRYGRSGTGDEYDDDEFLRQERIVSRLARRYRRRFEASHA